jgi:hypothetical protein
VRTSDNPSDDANSSAADVARILLDLYRENTGFVRHYEEIRFKFSQLTITLAAALVGLSKIANPGRHHEIIIALFICALGISGVLMVLTHTDRTDRHATIARAFRRTISRVLAQSLRLLFRWKPREWLRSILIASLDESRTSLT